MVGFVWERFLGILVYWWVSFGGSKGLRLGLGEFYGSGGASTVLYAPDLADANRIGRVVTLGNRRGRVVT